MSEAIARYEENTIMSFEQTDFESKKRIYNALNKADAGLKEMLNREINLVDVAVVGTMRTNPETGEVVQLHRSVLFDGNGNTYVSMSEGVYNSLKRISEIFGTLHFDNPLVIIPREIKTKNGFTIVLEVA